MKNVDFLAIGDIVVDDFIRLKDAEAYCDIDHEKCKLCVRFGDKVPYEFHKVIYAVGNSPNAAVSASRLGVSAGLSAVVGNDDYGKGCIASLEKDGVSTDYLETDPSLPTNYHYVFWYGPERTILVNHAPYERHLPKDMPVPKWLYLSSLGENTEAFHHEIVAWLKEHPETKLVYQPGTFQMKMGIEKTKEIYELAYLFFCNVEEAQRILKTEEKDVEKLMDMVHDLGPTVVVITDGVNGAYAREEDGSKWFMPIYPQEAIERTGAGDAFASTFASALCLGKTVDEALMWAPINSMSVVQKIGAQEGLLTRTELEDYLAKAPEDYKPKKLS